jgi:hypothetical protein
MRSVEPGISIGIFRHCEEPTGPRKARPDDRLRDEAIHLSPRGEMDCFASLTMTDETTSRFRIGAQARRPE